MGEEVIVGDNTRYTARQGPSPYTSSEMTDRIANKLTHLPNYTACIKTPSGEFVVETSLPRLPVGEYAFRDRVRFIWRNNLRQGFVRKRADVEATFLQREILAPPVSTPSPDTLKPGDPLPQTPLPKSRRK